MNYLSKTIAALCLSAPLGMGAFAAEEKAPPPQPMPGMNMPQGEGGMQGMGMMGMMGGMSEEQMDKHMRMKQEHMLQMHDLSNKILAATDPKEKQKLKDQQLKLMKNHHAQMMSMMHGGMGMGQGPKGSSAHEQHQQQSTGKSK
jgi:hypothetical protein